MEDRKKYLIIGAIILSVGVIVVVYLFRKPIYNIGTSVKTTGGCACTYTYAPSKVLGGGTGSVVNGTWAYIRGECDADPSCKGFTYDPVTHTGILALSADQSQWPASNTGDLGAYIKNS